MVILGLQDLRPCSSLLYDVDVLFRSPLEGIPDEPGEPFINIVLRLLEEKNIRGIVPIRMSPSPLRQRGGIIPASAFFADSAIKHNPWV
jgi:hypothetical protein